MNGDKTHDEDDQKVLAASLVELIGEVRSLQENTPELSDLPFRSPQDEEFCDRMNKTMQRITDVLTMHGLSEELQLYPLLRVPQRYDSGYDIRKSEAISGLNRTAELLKKRLQVLDIEAFLMAADVEEIAALLRSTRKLSGLSREETAEQLKVSPDTVKSWELGQNHPSAKHLRDLAVYFRTVLK
jgi:DNA-binding transcriptional regulator YiaG